MGYVGVNITGCNSPAVGNDKTTYSGIQDTTAQKIDLHDHTTGKGLQVPTAGIANGAITSAKLASGAALANVGSGNITGTYLASGSVDTGNLIDGSVTSAKIASAAVTTDKLSSSNHSVSSSTSSFLSSSTSFVDVTNATVTITSNGQPVFIGLQPDGSSDSWIGVTINAAATADVELQLLRGASVIAKFEMTLNAQNLSGQSTVKLPPGAVFFFDAVAAGTYTYKLQAKIFNNGGTTQVGVNGCTLFAKEWR